MRIGIRIFLITLLTVSSFGCATTGKNRAALPEVSTAEHLAELESRQSRERELDPNRLKNLPAPAIVERGQEALARNDLALARLHFTVALGKDDHLTAAYLGLAEVLRRKGQYDAAGTALSRSLQNEPENPEVLALLGVVDRTRGKTEEALNLLAQAVTLRPEDPALLTELAITYEKSAQLAEAGQYFQRTVELLPQSSAACNNLGFNLLLQEKYDEAIPVFEKARQLAPTDSLVTNNLALAYALNHESRKALQLFESSVGLAGAYNNLGYLLMLQDQTTDAERALTLALESSPVFYTRAKENLEQLKNLNRKNPGLFD